jgi:biopolymer transport protein ExbD
MAIQIKVEETKLNMTPMIDMTFLLVVFFMLTLDMTNKEFEQVDLPYAYQGTEMPKDEDMRGVFTINVLNSGQVKMKGHAFDLSSPDPAVQKQAIEAFEAYLRPLVQNPDFLEPDGLSRVTVIVHGDREAQWRYAQWVMQSAARLKVYRIRFTVSKPEPTK